MSAYSRVNLDNACRPDSLLSEVTKSIVVRAYSSDHVCMSGIQKVTTVGVAEFGKLGPVTSSYRKTSPSP